MAKEKDLFKFFTQCPNLILYGLPDLGIQEKWALVTLMGLCWDRTRTGKTLRELEGPYRLSLRQISAITGIAHTRLRNTKGKDPRVGVLEALQEIGYVTIVDGKAIDKITGTLGRMQTHLYIHLEKLWLDNLEFAARHEIPSMLVRQESIMIIIDGQIVPMPPRKEDAPMTNEEPLENPIIGSTRARVVDQQNIPYSEYLRSPEWAKKRAKALRFAQYKCQLCSSTENLNVHHRTYDRLGHELLSDLFVVCKDCHTIFHGNRDLAQET